MILGIKLFRKLIKANPFISNDLKLKPIVKLVSKKIQATNKYNLIKENKSPDIVICCLALKYYSSKKKQLDENKNL